VEKWKTDRGRAFGLVLAEPPAVDNNVAGYPVAEERPLYGVLPALDD
jgi:hypothetical protein